MKITKLHKFFLALILLAAVLIFPGCKGSTAIQGKWYAANSYNEKIQLNITQGEFQLKSKIHKKTTVKYKQVGTGFKNNTSYKELTIKGQDYTFVFPNKKNKDKALVIRPTDSDEPLKGSIVWVLSKKDYPRYPTQAVDLN